MLALNDEHGLLLRLLHSTTVPSNRLDLELVLAHDIIQRFSAPGATVLEWRTRAHRSVALTCVLRVLRGLCVLCCVCVGMCVCVVCSVCVWVCVCVCCVLCVLCCVVCKCV